MENASKALIMAASILISVMLIYVMINMFSGVAKTSRTFEDNESLKAVQAFNADFLGLETRDDDIVYIPNSGSYNGKRIIFETSEARIKAVKELNKVTDIVSAINSAYSINYENSNHYLSGNIEYINSMTIVIRFGKYTTQAKDITGSKYLVNYVIFPHPDIEPGYIYALDSTQYSTWSTNFKNRADIDISGYKKIELSKFLEYFRINQRYVDSYKNYTLYKYYFTGKATTDSGTGKINRLDFYLVQDSKF